MSTGMPAGIWLQKFGTIIRDYFGHVAYHVGSSLDRKDWRDVDVRLLLPDEEFAELFGTNQSSTCNPKLAAVTLAFAALGKDMTGLPIDFQIQPQSWANKHYPHKRSALIEVSPPAAAAPDADSGETYRQPCGCLTNDAGAHRGDCPDWATGRNEYGRYWVRRAADSGETADGEVASC